MTSTIITQGKRVTLCHDVVYITTNGQTDSVVYPTPALAHKAFQSVKRYAK